MSDPAAVWLSVKDTAELIKRHPDTVYAWIESGRVNYRRNLRGVFEVEVTAALAAESSVRIGRPRNTARPNISTKHRTDVLDKTSERLENVYRRSGSAPEGPST